MASFRHPRAFAPPIDTVTDGTPASRSWALIASADASAQRSGHRCASRSASTGQCSAGSSRKHASASASASLAGSVASCPAAYPVMVPAREFGLGLQHRGQHLALVEFGVGQRPGDRHPGRGGDQVQPQPPKPARMRRAVAVAGPARHGRALDGGARAGAFHRRGVGDPHVVQPEVGVGRQQPDHPLDQRQGGPQPPVVARGAAAGRETSQPDAPGRTAATVPRTGSPATPGPQPGRPARNRSASAAGPAIACLRSRHRSSHTVRSRGCSDQSSQTDLGHPRLISGPRLRNYSSSYGEASDLPRQPLICCRSSRVRVGPLR